MWRWLKGSHQTSPELPCAALYLAAGFNSSNQLLFNCSPNLMLSPSLPVLAIYVLSLLVVLLLVIGSLDWLLLCYYAV